MMPKRTDNEDQKTSEAPAVQILPRMVKGSVGLVAFALVWFGIAGRVTWVQGWTLLVAFVAYVAALAWRLARVDPDLLRERNRRAENVKPWDKAVMGCYTGLLMVLLVLSALDSGRFRWSVVPVWSHLLAWALVCVAGMVIWHVMAVNAYLSSWARIQEDRGQRVVREGLYRYVRHPMYLGIMLGFVGLPVVLGSWWALIPGVMIVGVFVYRTAREDGMLREELAGYEEYAEEVRYRLLPGIW
jgi:protein-S-isoprenylcysteine O-methyltransferase Ste14